VVDGKRVLIGSHNWSQPGVTLNRDASMIFYDKGIAGYFTEAFKIDWERSNKIAPRRHSKVEGVVTETVAGAPQRQGYRRVSLSELLKQED
jgi:phosphatidylserine/phosphatidylglycerophosphate/cardiolipin synthase-like enzyme